MYAQTFDLAIIPRRYRLGLQHNEQGLPPRHLRCCQNLLQLRLSEGTRL